MIKNISIFAIALVAVISSCKKEPSKPFHNIEGTYPCHGTVLYHDTLKTPVNTVVDINDTFHIVAIDDKTIKCTNRYGDVSAVLIKDDGVKISFGYEEHHVSYYSLYIEYDYSTKRIRFGSTSASSAASIGMQYTATDLQYP